MAADGTPLSDVLQLDNTGPGWREPIIAMNASGQFVITSNLTTTQAFASDGTPAGGEYTVTGLGQLHLLMDDAGGFLLTGTQGSQLVGQRFDMDGTPLGSEISIADLKGGRYYDIAGDADGSLVVAWSQRKEFPLPHEHFNPPYQIFAQRFDLATLTAGQPFRVDMHEPTEDSRIGVATNVAHEFVVTWDSQPTSDDPISVYARRLDAGDVPIGPDIQVNSSTVPSSFSYTGSTVWKNVGQDFSVLFNGELGLRHDYFRRSRRRRCRSLPSPGCRWSTALFIRLRFKSSWPPSTKIWTLLVERPTPIV